MRNTDFYDEFFLEKISRKPTINKNILFNETVKKIEEYFSGKKQPDYEVLDIGCGLGHLVNKISALDNVSVSGADITREILVILKEKYPEVDFYHKDFSKPVTFGKNLMLSVPLKSLSMFSMKISQTLSATALQY